MNSTIIRDLDTLHPYVKQQALKVLEDCKKVNLNVHVFETLRTYRRQVLLKERGTSKTLTSYHRLGLAVDFVFQTEAGNWSWAEEHDWDQLSDILERHNFYSLWKHKGWDGPHGQVMINGTNASIMCGQLDGCDNDLERFWEANVNSHLNHKLDSVTIEHPIEESPKDSEQATDESTKENKPTFITLLIDLVLKIIQALIGKKK